VDLAVTRFAGVDKRRVMLVDTRHLHETNKFVRACTKHYCIRWVVSRSSMIASAYFPKNFAKVSKQYI